MKAPISSRQPWHRVSEPSDAKDAAYRAKLDDIPAPQAIAAARDKKLIVQSHLVDAVVGFQLKVVVNACNTGLSTWDGDCPRLSGEINLKGWAATPHYGYGGMQRDAPTTWEDKRPF